MRSEIAYFRRYLPDMVSFCTRHSLSEGHHFSRARARSASSSLAMAYFNVASYVISRLSFLATHLVFAYWLNFIFNDPFNLSSLFGDSVVATLDAKKVLPAGQCTAINWDNLLIDVLHFGIWYAPSVSTLTNFLTHTGGVSTPSWLVAPSSRRSVCGTTH